MRIGTSSFIFLRSISNIISFLFRVRYSLFARGGTLRRYVRFAETGGKVVSDWRKGGDWHGPGYGLNQCCKSGMIWSGSGRWECSKTFWTFFKDFVRKFVRFVIKDKLNHFEEKSRKLYRISCQKVQIRIWYNYSGLDLGIKFGFTILV